MTAPSKVRASAPHRVGAGSGAAKRRYPVSDGAPVEVIESGPIATVPGQAGEPLTREQVWDKFRECTAQTHSDDEARELFAALQRIDSLTSTDELPTCTSIFTSN